jgi:hypothetical protein
MTLQRDCNSERLKQGESESSLTVFRIRIRIHMFFGLLHPDTDPIVRGMDPDPSIIKQK